MLDFLKGIVIFILMCCSTYYVRSIKALKPKEVKYSGSRSLDFLSSDFSVRLTASQNKQLLIFIF